VGKGDLPESQTAPPRRGSGGELHEFAAGQVRSEPVGMDEGNRVTLVDHGLDEGNRGCVDFPV
jgi:hypothetical protein